MKQRPKSLDEIWSEKDLCIKLDLPRRERSGHSIQLTHWIKGGLKFVEKAGKRYFFEQDIIDYLWQRYLNQTGEDTSE